MAWQSVNDSDSVPSPQGQHVALVCRGREVVFGLDHRQVAQGKGQVCVQDVEALPERVLGAGLVTNSIFFCFLFEKNH